jgi:hypothetical protein
MTGYELAELQRGLRDVIAGRPYDGELPYLRQLVKALARFERSLHAVSLDGDGQTYHVDWPCDPIAVLSSILERRLVTEVPGRYRTEISAAVPGGWRVIAIDQHDPLRDNV